MSDPIAALEARANAAEEAIETLKKQQGESSNAAVAAKLQQLKSLMEEDRKEAEEVRAHRDELKEENEKLRALNAKLSYRIHHLLNTIKEVEEANARK